MKLQSFVLCFAFVLTSQPVNADLLVVQINQNKLPYDLSPNNYNNRPAKYDNSSSEYSNNASNYSNSSSNYDNSPSNYENTIHGKRRLITKDNKFVGYYAYSDDGVLNFFNSNGRVAYMPSGGHTRSIFTSGGSQWCGTIGEINGRIVLGLTQNCLLRFLIN